MTQRTLSKLSRSECNSLMRGRRVGRLAYCDSLGPVAVPVNFALAGDDIVIRMEPTNTAIQMGQSLVAFETDQVDETSGEGWSVVVRGPVEELDADSVLPLLRELGDGPPQPWADGVHNVWLRITSKVVTGRRLGGYAAPLVM